MAELNDKTLVSIFDGVSSYVKTHERLILIVIACVLAWGVSGKIQGLIAEHDKRAYDSAQAKLETQVQLNATTAANNEKLAQEWKDLNAATQAQNAALERQNSELLVGLKQQQKTDATLIPTELSARIQNLAELPDKSVSPTPSGTFDVTNAGAVKLVQALELIPVQKVQLANAEAEKKNIQASLDKQTNEVIPGLKTEITGLHSQIGDTQNVCDLRVKVEKDKARAGKRKWFLAGVIVGFIGRSILPKP